MQDATVRRLRSLINRTIACSKGEYMITDVYENDKGAFAQIVDMAWSGFEEDGLRVFDLQVDAAAALLFG